MLDINIYLIIGQALTFIIGLLILWRVAYRPITAVFRQRADKISGDLAAAEKARAEMEKGKLEYAAQMARLAENAQQMMNKAVKESQAARDEILQAARGQSKEMLDRAIAQIEIEKEKAIREMRQQVLDISMLVAEKTIGEAVGEDLQGRIVDRVFAQLESAQDAPQVGRRTTV